MENKWLNVHDEDLSTEGGPPGWLAFAAAAIAFLFVTAFVLLLILIWWT